VAQVQAILRTQFPGISEKDVARLPDQMHNPLKYRLRSILFVAEGTKGKEGVRGGLPRAGPGNTGSQRWRGQWTAPQRAQRATTH
jgi:hypothetical protein